MKKINLAITGCMGRMGQQLVKSIKSDKTFKLVALTENRFINKNNPIILPKNKNLTASVGSEVEKETITGTIAINICNSLFINNLTYYI